MGKKDKLKKLEKRERKLEKKEFDLEKKFKAFIRIWQKHIMDEISVHKNMLRGKHSFRKHVEHTKKIHEKMMALLKKV